MKLALLPIIFLIPQTVFSQLEMCKNFAISREINNPNSAVEVPNNLICKITFNRRNRLNINGHQFQDNSTFSFISSKILIGAAHSLTQNKSTIKSIDIQVYEHVEKGKIVTLYSRNLKLEKDFTILFPFSGNHKSSDCGLLKLKSSFLNEKYFFLLSTKEEAQTKMVDTIHLSGYPYPLIASDQDFTGEKLWQRDIEIAKTYYVDNNNVRVNQVSGVLGYDCVKTNTGDSGGPIWYKMGNNYFLIGTHITGAANKINNVVTSCSAAAEVFTEGKIQILNSIIANSP